MKKTCFTILTILVMIFSFSLTVQAEMEQEYYQQGVEQYDKGNYEKALHYFEQASNINPKESVYYDWQGSCLYHLVAFEEALQAFDKALALEPYYTTYEYKGVCLAALGRTEEAINAFDQSISLYPYLNNYFWKAAILLSSQKLPEAASTYLSVAALKDTDNETKALAYNNAGYALYVNKNYEKAMEAIEKGLGLKQDKSNLYKNKGLILEAQGNYDGAMENYNRALEIEPNNQLALTARRNLSAKLDGKPLDPTQFLEWEEIKLYVPSDKIWTIVFNRPVDLESAKEYIHITDKDNNQLSLKIEAGNSANVVKVSLANEQGYASSARYTLFVPSDVQTTGGVKMISGVKMDFISK